MKWFCLCAVLGAAANPGELLEAAKHQLEQHREADARKTLERAKSLAADKPQLLAQIYLYLGLAYAENAEQRRATEAFQAALKLDRAVKLPADSAPKVIEWWTRAGGTAPATPELPPAVAQTTPPLPEPPPPPPPAPVVEPQPVQPVEIAAAPRSSSHWWGVPAVAGAVCAIIGGVLVQQSESRYQQLTLGTFDVDTSMVIKNQGETLQTASWVMFGASAVAVVAAILFWALIDR